jgi:GDPmannose 4,6-dehydratase
MKKALITGITGQDGSYMAELLLEKGYEVYGMVRRISWENYERINHLRDKIKFVSGDLNDTSSLDEIIRKVKPDEVYNLAAQSFVPASWEQPILTAEVTAVGVLKLLEAIRKNKPDTKFYQASSSEMFGKVQEVPQKETTPFYPRSPYGVSKVFAHYITINYRESYNIFACSGICFNHESPRRGLEFVTRKISYGVAQIMLGVEKKLRLGNLDAKRDWGFAGDYVEAMWLMLQQDNPDDYVIATGETHTVKEFVEKSFLYFGVELQWEGENENSKGIIKSIDNKKCINKNLKIGDIVVVSDKQFYRPAEVDLLIGDSTKAKQKLGWKPKVSFNQLVEMMVEAELKNFGYFHNR